MLLKLNKASCFCAVEVVNKFLQEKKGIETGSRGEAASLALSKGKKKLFRDQHL